jgi:hypothetical protein
LTCFLGHFDLRSVRLPVSDKRFLPLTTARAAESAFRRIDCITKLDRAEYVGRSPRPFVLGRRASKLRTRRTIEPLVVGRPRLCEA